MHGSNFRKGLEIFEDEANPGQTKVDNLNIIEVKSEVEAFKYFLHGDENKKRGAHSIFTIYISSKSHTISGGKIKHAELKFVDLTSWGSAIVSKNKIPQNTKSGGALALGRVKAASVPSLSFLEQVIITLKNSANRNSNEFVTWRSCPLTHVLKGSFNRVNTVLLSTIYGDREHLQGSLMTMRFSARVNNLPVEAAYYNVNDAESRVVVLENEINKLKEELKMMYIFNRKDDKTAACSSYEPLTEKEINYMQGNVKEFLDFKSHKLDVLSLRHVNKLFDLMREEYANQNNQIINRIKNQYHLRAASL